MNDFPICIVKKEKPNAGWVEYDCESCDGTLKNANCGGEYYRAESETIKPEREDEDDNKLLKYKGEWRI